MKGLSTAVEKILSATPIHGVVGKGVVCEIRCVNPPEDLTPILTVRFDPLATREEVDAAYQEIVTTSHKFGRVFLLCADIPISVVFEKDPSTGYLVHCYYSSPFSDDPTFATDTGLAYISHLLGEYVRQNQGGGVGLQYEVMPYQKRA